MVGPEKNLRAVQLALRTDRKKPNFFQAGTTNNCQADEQEDKVLTKSKCPTCFFSQGTDKVVIPFINLIIALYIGKKIVYS